MRDIPQSIIDALDAAVFRPLWLVEIQFDDPLLFASAYTEVTVDGKTYFGAGNLGYIKSFSEGTDLDPQQIEIGLAGISDASLSAVSQTNYINRDVTVKLAMLGEQGEILGDTAMTYFIGKTDEIRYSYGKKSEIIVIVRDRLADWARPSVEKNVNAYHQARFPGDKGFEFVGQVTDKKIIWPAGEFFE